MNSEHSSIIGQTVLVTGAGQGLGRATCLAFARRGAKIALVDINEGTLHDVREELNNSGAECTVIVGDISGGLPSCFPQAGNAARRPDRGTCTTLRTTQVVHYSTRALGSAGHINWAEAMP